MRGMFTDLSHGLYEPRYFMSYIRLCRFLYKLHISQVTEYTENDFKNNLSINPF